MGFNNLVLKQGLANVTTSGGDPDMTFKSDGQTIPNGIHTVCVSDDYADRRQITAKVRLATVDPKTGTYSKDKRSVSIAMPTELSDGRIIFNTVRIETEVHPSAHSSGALLRSFALQVLSATDTQDFWDYGSY